MYIKVKVFAGAKKEFISKLSEDSFEIRVKEKARHNMANERVIALLAEYFSLSKKNVRIVNGHHHPSKLIFINL